MKVRVSLLTFLTAVALGFAAVASSGDDQWNCRNIDLEISCGLDGCIVSDAHTPMDVTVSAKEIRACAYTGCWEGRPSARMQSGHFQVFTGTALPFSTNPEDTADISLTVDAVTGTGTILVAGLYAQPVQCVLGNSD